MEWIRLGQDIQFDTNPTISALPGKAINQKDIAK